jgi:hypothetical protein
MDKKKKRIKEALNILEILGMPHEQINDRTAICLLALLDLPESKKWSEATAPMLGIRDILDFARQKLSVNYAENTRESVRKYSVKQLVAAGVVLHNPDKLDRSVNSSNNCYQIEKSALALFQSYGSNKFKKLFKNYEKDKPSLVKKFAKKRDMQRVPIKIKPGVDIKLSSGNHSDLIRSIIEEFAPRFIPGGELVYIGDTGAKWGYFDKPLLNQLGVEVGHHGKMPDLVIYYREKNWLVLVEAVTSSGPVDSLRHSELAELFKNSSAGLVYVTAFPNRNEIMRKYLSVVAWETEVWCASDPTHLIHFNGSRFLGPYTEPRQK